MKMGSWSANLFFPSDFISKFSGKHIESGNVFQWPLNSLIAVETQMNRTWPQVAYLQRKTNMQKQGSRQSAVWCSAPRKRVEFKGTKPRKIGREGEPTGKGMELAWWASKEIKPTWSKQRRGARAEWEIMWEFVSGVPELKPAPAI